MHKMEQNKLYYVDDCVYWYTSEDLEKWFVGSLGKRFHVKSLGYAHWCMSIRISQIQYHSVSIDQARYATSIVENTWILPQLTQLESFIIPL